MEAAAAGDKAGSLSTRPEPSLPIFSPPTSIDDVVCGGGGEMEGGGSGLITFSRDSRPLALLPLVMGGCICC